MAIHFYDTDVDVMIAGYTCCLGIICFVVL